MEDEQFIGELERIVGQDDSQARTARAKLLQEIKRRAAEYQQINQHWIGISLLERARKVIAPMTDLDRMMALALGREAELIMDWADGLRVHPPADLLSLIEADLREATDVDPTLEDPYWDLAVINARYHADYGTAAKCLEEATVRGCIHPMMARLESMIQAKPPLESVPDIDAMRLRQLVLQLAVQAAGPMHSCLLDEEESEVPTDKEDISKTLQTFGDYVREAKAIVAHESISEAQYMRILGDSRAITGDSSDYVTDLLRRVAEFVGEKLFLDHATGDHIRLIRDMAFHLFGKREEDSAWLKKSRRAAQRGLEVIEGSIATIDPDLHADLLFAKGKALYYEDDDQRYATEVIRCYQNALQLKRQAQNTAEVEKMKDILWRQIDHRVRQAISSPYIGGIGEALEILKVCAEVADELDDPPRAMDINVKLAGVMLQVGQYNDAEQILHEVIESLPPENVARAAKSELASVYSETSRPSEAAEIQRELLDEGEMDNDQTTTAVLWSNYANSLRLLDDFGGARDALEKAWELLPPEQKQKIGNTIPDQGARIKMLLAQIDFTMGYHAEALNYIDAAEELNSTPIGLDSLHFYEIKARCLMALGRSDEARECLDTATHNFKYLLSRGPSLPSWESLLQQWSHLDMMAVRAHIDSELADGFENALLRAESAKGRVLAWIERWFAPKGAEWALGLERQVKGLEKARQWLRERPDRRIVSLFGSDEGIGVFNVDESGQVTGAWLDDFNYDLFRRDVYDPWGRLVEQALNDGDPDTLALSGSLTDYLLDSVGTWLWRAQPGIAEGGTDLVIIPHRLFRSLPLAHARLPTGRRLSDLFDRVIIVPSLGDIEHRLDASVNTISQTTITALADADEYMPLPFARCEAILSGAGENVMTRDTVTADAVAEAFKREGILLLSLHGDFDEENPFHSKIFTADGDLSLHQLMLGQTPINSRIVVLGVCEAGRSRRSLSDEPLGFPAMLLQSGVAAVLAPAWQVDDFASFLFISKLFDTINQGINIFRAVQDTAHWLREVTAQDVLEHTYYLINRVIDSGEQGKMAVEALKPRLDEQKAWVETLKPTERPFRSPLDWAAFQITGVPPVSTPVLQTKMKE